MALMRFGCTRVNHFITFGFITGEVFNGTHPEARLQFSKIMNSWLNILELPFLTYISAIRSVMFVTRVVVCWRRQVLISFYKTWWVSARVKKNGKFVDLRSVNLLLTRWPVWRHPLQPRVHTAHVSMKLAYVIAFS